MTYRIVHICKVFPNYEFLNVQDFHDDETIYRVVCMYRGFLQYMLVYVFREGY